MMEYMVRFRPGRYKVASKDLPNGRCWLIGREDDGEIAAWSWNEIQAKHVCLALNVVDSYLGGDAVANRELLAALSKMRD